MKTKKVVIAILILALGITFTACGSKKKENSIVIWTSGEDYKNDFYLTSLKERFPDYDFTLEYMSSSSIAAKIMEEGENCSCDIVLSEEYGYLEMCQQYLAEIDNVDFDLFLDELVPSTHKYTPEVKNGGCIILNNAVLKEKNLSAPVSYKDLLNEKYKDLISMPNPASSGTGYMFLRQLTNEWGEDKAFAYFDSLTNNILQYTSSGSGPVNALIQGEVAIGLGMTSQAVVEINQGVDLSIVFFEEGSPFSMYGNGVLKNSYERACVKEVFEYIATDLVKGVNEKYFPDKIFKDVNPVIEGFPTDINYGNMSNDTRVEKERLLSKWTH